jgi:hypothetical protein
MTCSVQGYDVLVVVALAMMSVARFVVAPTSLQADTWLDLVDARTILHSGLPHQELLTTMTHGHVLVDQQWLAQLLVYGFARIGGLAWLAVGFVLVPIVSLAGATVAARRIGGHPRMVLLFLAVAWWFTFTLLQMRPEVLVLPLFIALLYLLATDSRHSTPRVYICLPLLVLWANIHGSVILAACLVSARGVTLAWERRHELTHATNWIRPLVLIVGAPISVLVTPYGLNTVSYYRETMVSPVLREYVSEWRPITHTPAMALPFFVMVALTLYSLRRYPNGATLWERLALLVLAVSAFTAVRNAVWFGVGILVLLPAALTPNPSPLNDQTEHRPLLRLAVVAVALTAVLVSMARTLSLPNDRFQTGAPRGGLNAIRGAAASDPSLKIFADWTIADWLLWRDPELAGRVAYNDQLELLSERQASQIMSLNLVVGGNWQRAARGDRLLVLNNQLFPQSVRAFARTPGTEVLFRSQQYWVMLRTAQAAA